MLADDKEEIRRRLALAKYRRRSSVHLADDPEHNPEVLEDCARCRGRGQACTSSKDDEYALEECPDCKGSGTTYRVVRYFENDRPAQSAELDAKGWITCPGCGRRFSSGDHGVWTGLRHRRCGQRIILR